MTLGPLSFPSRLRLSLAFLVLSVLPFAARAANAATPPAPGQVTEPAIAPAQPRLPPLIQARGSELAIELTRADLRTQVRGSVATTLLTLTFTNPNSRVLEGELQFPLREGQTVQAFSLEMADGSLMKAVPVPKARGREVFEAVVRQRVDPALLEQTAGEQFKLRIYPLAPKKPRQVQIELQEWLPVGNDGRQHLRLPLNFAGTPAQALQVQVSLPAVQTQQISLGEGLAAADVRTEGDGTLVSLQRAAFLASSEQLTSEGLAWPAVQRDTVLTSRIEGRGYMHAELQVPSQTLARAKPEHIALVWDASGSGLRRDHAREFQLLAALFKWQPQATVHLRVVRDAAEPLRQFAVKDGDWRLLREALEATAYDGASNAALWSEPIPMPAGKGLTLLFSDGLGNWGDSPAEPAKDGPAAFAVNASTTANALYLRQWAERRGGVLLDLFRQEPAQALGAVQQQSLRLARVEGEGFADWAVPSRYPEDGRMLIAARLTAASATLDLVFEGADGQTQRKALTLQAPPPSAEGASDFAAKRWAQLRVAEMLGQAHLHKAEIQSLGQRFGIVTPETSLIVLESLADFIRFDITPPAGPWRQAFFEQRERGQSAQLASKTRRLDNLAQRFAEFEAWWAKDFPKEARPASKQAPLEGIEGERGVPPPPPHFARPPELMLSPPPAMAAPAPAPMAAPAQAFSADPNSARERSGVVAAPQRQGQAVTTIRLQAWVPDTRYQKRLAEAQAQDRYAIYLDERPQNAASTAFFLDAAEVFKAKGQLDLALRVLSNLAEIEAENRSVLRILAYRLQEMGAKAEALRVLRRVAEIAPDEPQSSRDLGLAYAANGQYQKAIEALWETATGQWDARFPDIDLIALHELNAIAAQHPGLDTAIIDPRLQHNLPLDLRVVLAWDADNVDLDLWVKDPNGEWVSYAQPLSYQGGRISRDAVRGYGPEVYSLKVAKPGRYEVRAKFFGSSRQVISGAPSLMLQLSTGFGSKKQQDRQVILRLQNPRDDILVGTFDVGLPTQTKP